MPETFMNLSPARPRTLSVKLTRHWRAWGSESWDTATSPHTARSPSLELQPCGLGIASWDLPLTHASNLTHVGRAVGFFDEI